MQIRYIRLLIVRKLSQICIKKAKSYFVRCNYSLYSPNRLLLDRTVNFLYVIITVVVSDKAWRPSVRPKLLYNVLN